MHTQQIAIFLIVTVSILIAVDFYVLFHWKNFVKLKSWNKLAHIIPKYISYSMIIVCLYIVLIRYLDNLPNSIDKAMYLTAGIWYLPKLIIIPFLLTSKLIKIVREKFLKTKQINLNKAKLKRREFITTTGWTLAGVPFLAATNGVLKTTNDFEIIKVNVPLPKLPIELDGLKIGLISDLHAGSFFSRGPIDRAITMLNSLDPDLIAVTGDFVNFKADELIIALPGLRRLNAEFGVYGCLGNHDHYMTDFEHQRLIKMLRDSGIELMINENKVLNIRGAQLLVAGADNISPRKIYGNIDDTLRGLDKVYPTILLCHDPWNWDNSIKDKTHVDLMLSGHTHGGQFGIELFGEHFTPARYILKQFAGLYRHNEQFLYINKGLGTTGPPIRIGVKPEITLITLKSINNLA